MKSTWGGSTEALKKGWVPIFVVDGPDVPEGNRLLIEKGAIPFPVPFTEGISRFQDFEIGWMSIAVILNPLLSN